MGPGAWRLLKIATHDASVFLDTLHVGDCDQCGPDDQSVACAIEAMSRGVVRAHVGISSAVRQPVVTYAKILVARVESTRLALGDARGSLVM